MFGGIRLRLTLLYTFLSTLALAGFALLFYLGLASVLLREQGKDLNLFASHISHEAREVLKHGPEQWATRERAGHKKFRPPLPDAHIVFLLDATGRLVGTEAQIAGAKPPQTVLAVAAAGGEGLLEGTLAGTEAQPRYLWSVLQLWDDGRLRGSLVVGRDLSEYDHVMTRIGQVLLISLLLFPLLAGLIGHFAAGRAMRPIRLAFEAQRRFVADASHELRTPLSVIQASLEVIDKEDGSRLSPLSRQVFDDLKDESVRMGRLAGQLLTLAQADAGAVALATERFAALPVLEHVNRCMQPLAASRGVALTVTGAAAVLLADRDRITQLLMILVDNGIKFSPAGGEVRLSVARQDRDVVLTVADTGIGLADTDRRKIFERFYRVDKARSREDGGSGLGLSIAAWIVHAHGGRIEVLAREGGGSIFRVVLPASE